MNGGKVSEMQRAAVSILRFPQQEGMVDVAVPVDYAASVGKDFGRLDYTLRKQARVLQNLEQRLAALEKEADRG